MASICAYLLISFIKHNTFEGALVGWSICVTGVEPSDGVEVDRNYTNKDPLWFPAGRVRVHVHSLQTGRVPCVCACTLTSGGRCYTRSDHEKNENSEFLKKELMTRSR